METIAITFRVHPSLKQAVEHVAARRDETLSQILRRAMRDYLAAHSQMALPNAAVMRAGEPKRPIGRPRTKVSQAADDPFRDHNSR